MKKHVCRGFVVLDVVADRQLHQWRYRRRTHTQNAYRCILHGKTACLQLLLTVHLPQDELTALSAIARATGDVCDHIIWTRLGAFPITQLQYLSNLYYHSDSEIPLELDPTLLTLCPGTLCMEKITV